MDSGNWMNFLIKWISNIEMWNPLKSETNVYWAANQHQTIELEFVLFEFVSQNWTVCPSTTYIYIDLFSSWCQSKWWWLKPIIVEQFRFDSMKYSPFNMKFLSKTILWKNINFLYLVIFIWELQQQSNLWQRATSTDRRRSKYVSVLRTCFFFLEYIPQPMAVCLIIQHKQYGWNILSVN